MTHTDNPNAGPEFNVGDVVCISAEGRHQNMTGRIVEVQPNGACEVHIPRTDANGLPSDDRIWYSASHLKSGNAADLKPASTPDIFTRLERRGLHYPDIKIKVFMEIPDAELFYALNWKGQSFEKMLGEIERKRTILKENFPDHSHGRSRLDAELATSKIGLLNRILMANPRLGDLVIQCSMIPHPILDDSDTREHASPSICITVFKKTAERTISPDAEALEQALKELGIENERQRALLKLKEKFPDYLPGHSQSSVRRNHADWQMDAALAASKINLLDLILANRRVGDLVIHCCDDSDTREHASPSIRITVFKKTAERTISPDTVENPVTYAEALEQALKELGIWEILRKDNPARKLLNERPAHGWPIFTQGVIPALYEMMHPHYPARAYFSEKIDGEEFETQRLAVAPKELLQDMLDILKTERPDIYRNYDTAALKAVIQRYVLSKTKKNEER
jgi:hypothetical protein